MKPASPRNQVSRSRRANRAASGSSRALTQPLIHPQRKGVRDTPDGPPTGKRLLATLIVLALVAGGLVYRLVDLQLRHAEEFVEIGRQQRFRTVQLAGGRGEILDRNGNPLATSLPATSFFVDPLFVEDPIGDAARLAPVLGMPVEQLRERMGGDGRFAWLLRQASDAKAAELLALDIPGVYTTTEPTRFHPSGNALARSVVGDVDIDSVGKSGAEGIFNEQLEGQAGELLVEIGLHGNTIPGEPELVKAAAPGADVVLTLDRSLQFEVERVLIRTVSEMGAAGGVVIVSDPITSETLAMASVTRNDDNEVVSSSLNMATSWTFEPGSVMKAMTFASVLDAGLATPTSEIVVPDSLRLYEETFTDSSPHAPAEWSIADIVTVSSNVGTIMWGQELGGVRLDKYLRGFGFGEAAGLGFPGESAGLMPEPDNWGGVGNATTALGQGIAVTPAQMLAAYNTIANDGIFTPLQIVREIVRADGTVEVPPAPDQRQVVSPQVARQVRSMLENAVSVGTGTNAQVDGYRVAGKTGTARKVLDRGGYLDSAGNFHYIASFVGFLPADNPELSILVTIDNPTASFYAGHVAAPAFAEIASYAVRHFRIAPPSEVSAAGPWGRVEVPDQSVDRVASQVAEVEEPVDDAPDPTTGEGSELAGPAAGATASPQTESLETVEESDFAELDESEGSG